MMRAIRNFGYAARRLGGDRRGVTAVETAIIMPVFLLLALGTFDLGYLMYNRAMLNGLVYKAARDSTIESNLGDTERKVDKTVRDFLLIGASQADVRFTRRNYADFTSAAQSEPYADANKNKKCDNGEAFEDRNGNGVWDDGGVTGEGSAKDVVIYRVELTYPRLMPMSGLMGVPDKVKLAAQTVVENQPFASQRQRQTSVGYCS